jgi:hypothetical protein
MYDVASYLGIGADRVDAELRSYDHGAGHLLEEARNRGELEPTGGEVIRFKMTRGRNGRLLSRKELPVRSSAMLDRMMECFGTHGMMRPVVKLRPLGNLKNK